MNATERAKVEALSRLVKIPDWGYGAVLVKNLRWRLEREPAAPLSPQERYLLELCCWHYRRKLGGLVAFPLPKAEPDRNDYQPQVKTVQESLL